MSSSITSAKLSAITTRLTKPRRPKRLSRLKKLKVPKKPVKPVELTKLAAPVVLVARMLPVEQKLLERLKRTQTSCPMTSISCNR